MTYSGIQLSALVNLGLVMAQADGHVDQNEQKAIALELCNFGVDPNNAPAILAGSASMSATESLAIIASMTTEQKKYATGYFAAIMAADGDISDAEVKLWQLICTLANFPTMTIYEALSFWRSH